MAGRKGEPTHLDPNAPQHGNEGTATRMRALDPSEASERNADRQQARSADAVTDELLNLQQADQQRIYPRARTDALNPNKRRTMPGQSTRRSMLSSNRKKDYNRTKRQWLSRLPKTQRKAIEQTISNADNMETVNRALATVNGRRDRLPPNLHRQVQRIDNALRAYSRDNDREHIVYTYALPPRDTPASRRGLVQQLQSMQPGAEMTFDRYTPADHSLGNLADRPNDVVMEIKTTQGAYLGTSDTTTDASHMLPGGRYRFLGLHTNVEYTKPDGTAGSRKYVARFEEIIDDNERTQAKT